MFGRSPNVRKRLCKHTLAPAWLTVYSYRVFPPDYTAKVENNEEKIQQKQKK